YDEVVLTVNPVPTCSISGPDGPLCPGASSQTYSAPASTSYEWSISGNGTINGSTTGQTVSVTAGNVCNGSFVLSLKGTNDAGCNSTCTKTVNIGDSQAPVIAGVGPNGTVNCPATPSFSSPTATDNCGTATLTFADTPLAAVCPAISVVKRTWTATDNCGNTSTASQTISVEDHTAPTIAGVGADGSVECPASPSFSSPTASDACGSATLTFADTPLPATCPAISVVKRTWTATDQCGNTATASQTISVEDHGNPTITGVGPSGSIDCPATPSFSTPTA